MDSVKRKRGVQRGAFTRALNAFNDACSAEDDVYQESVAFQLLDERMKELETTTKAAIELMYSNEDITEEQITQEIEAASSYKAKFIEAKLYHDRRSAAAITSGPPISRAVITDQSDAKRTFKLPKIELVKFSGDVREWVLFWSLFKKIHDDTNISREDKFQYLVQSMVPDSRAAGLVKSFPPSAENYEKAVASLKKRFGRDDVLIETYVRDLLQLVLHNALKPNKELSLSMLYDKLESHLRALETLGVTTEKYAAILYPLVESSLPEDLLRAWQRSGANRHEATLSDETMESKDRLTRLMEFIEIEVRNEVKITMAMKGFSLNTSESVKRNKSNSEKMTPTAAGLLDVKATHKCCIFCSSKDHYSDKCIKAKNMSIAERQEFVKSKGNCFKCLRGGHQAKMCRVHVKCTNCSRRHVTLMCPTGLVKRAKEAEESAKDVNTDTVKNECNLASMCETKEVFLQTLKVEIYSDKKSEIVRALIDTGSQRSYIIKDVAARMGYTAISEQKLSHLLFGGGQMDSVLHKEYKVRLRGLYVDFSCNFSVLDQTRICEGVPSVSDKNLCEELKCMNIELSDWHDQDRNIAILIGADVAGKLLTGRRHVLSSGLVALETRLGWTVMGAINRNGETEENAVTAISMFVQSCSIEELWSLDVLGIKDPIAHKTIRQQERELEAAFRESVIVNGAGRYEVQLPWRENHPPLQENRELARKRLQAVVNRLKKEGLYEDYAAIFQGWLTDGIIEYVPSEKINSWGHYLPHRHVIKEGSTTRVRPVFDASAKCHPHPSLNECLKKGPNLIELLPDVLLRFRVGEIGVIADIEKAFLQISVSEKERDFMRFLWLNENSEIITLRHCRVVFGVCSSPFILGAILNLHIDCLICDMKNYNGIFTSHVIHKLKNSFYIDNCISSVNSETELNDFIIQARQAMQLGNFNLRGWEYSFNNANNNQATVLGMKWYKKEDVLGLSALNLEDINLENITKRNILSLTHRVFDPLGFAAPVTLCPRLLLKEVWLKNLKWDEEIDGPIRSYFLKWVTELKDLPKIKLPRCVIGEIKPEDDITLHTFCDASESAYATVVFIRMKGKAGIKVSFVQAKSRVTPVKENSDARRSIPRLELLAATIGARLSHHIIKILNCKSVKTYYWSDSTTVLAWIRRQNNWGAFVYNRVKEIREISEVANWRHVPGTLNPADLPSRGCSIAKLLNSKWWEGPQWLYEEIEQWPHSEGVYDESEITLELKGRGRKVEIDNKLLTCIVKTYSKNLEPTFQFSSYTKLLRVTAWLQRFIQNCRSNLTDRARGELTLTEINCAEIGIIKSIQSMHFVDVEHRDLQSLEPFIDENNLIRLKSKILLREDTLNFKCPIILPYNNYIVDLIIKDKHEKLNHAGTHITLNALREKFWVLKGRKRVKSIINKCINCKRFDGQVLKAQAAPLPLNRVRDAAIFEIIGIDFAGPVFLKDNKKSWICIFTCAVFRAVHLELINSLNVGSLLMGLRRFIARRGRPSVIYSDNGTNFVGLSNKLKESNINELIRATAMQRIEWKFIPPSAPWWGGFWERLIGVLKRMLRRTLKKACLDYESMCTVLIDCEAIINSRPITFLSSSDQEFVPLSPSLFLQEVKEIGVLDLDKIECKLDKRYNHRMKIKENLRWRFRAEYLGSLVHYNKNCKNIGNINIGDMVLIVNDDIKRIHWPLGKVVDIYPGKDGKVRVVRLATTKGQLLRPIQKIVPLEINFKDSDINCHQRMIEQCKTVKENIQPQTQCIETPLKTRSGREVRMPDRLTYL